VSNPKKLRAWLKARGMTQVHMAESIGATALRLNRWLAGAAVPLPVFRKEIEEFTGGEVKAEDW